jgi:hypothetical protein
MPVEYITTQRTVRTKMFKGIRDICPCAYTLAHEDVWGTRVKVPCINVSNGERIDMNFQRHTPSKFTIEETVYSTHGVFHKEHTKRSCHKDTIFSTPYKKCKWVLFLWRNT